MNTSDVLAYLEVLEDDLDDLEESLTTLLPADSLAEVSKKLPLLDHAKLHVTVVYAIESLLFSYLRLQNRSPHSHQIFKELTRVKSYFDKIKEVEDAPTKQKELALDKQAAGRMIKHALAGNNKIDLEAAERKAKEALLAKRKLRELERKRSESETVVLESDPVVPQESEGVVPEEVPEEGEWEGSEEGEIEDGEVSTSVPVEVEMPVQGKKEKKKSKKERRRQREAEMAEGGLSRGKKKRKHSSMSAI